MIRNPHSPGPSGNEANATTIERYYIQAQPANGDLAQKTGRKSLNDGPDITSIAGCNTGQSRKCRSGPENRSKVIKQWS